MPAGRQWLARQHAVYVGVGVGWRTGARQPAPAEGTRQARVDADADLQGSRTVIQGCPQQIGLRGECTQSPFAGVSFVRMCHASRRAGPVSGALGRFAVVPSCRKASASVTTSTAVIASVTSITKTVTVRSRRVLADGVVLIVRCV